MSEMKKEKKKLYETKVFLIYRENVYLGAVSDDRWRLAKYYIFCWKESLSSLLFRVTITRATTVVLIIRAVMDHFRTEGMRPNNT